MMAPDLNAYALFAEVVTHGGFLRFRDGAMRTGDDGFKDHGSS